MALSRCSVHLVTGLKSGQDYSIGLGVGAVEDQKAVSLLVQLYSQKAQDQQKTIQRFIEKAAPLSPLLPVVRISALTSPLCDLGVSYGTTSYR